MTIDREVIELERRLRVAELIARLDRDVTPTPYEIASEAFLEGVIASTRPRSLQALTGLLQRRVGASRLK